LRLKQEHSLKYDSEKLLQKEEKNVKQEDVSDEEDNNSDDDNDNEGGIMIPIKEFLKEILKTPRHE